jgi:hypothetical protein
MLNIHETIETISNRLQAVLLAAVLALPLLPVVGHADTNPLNDSDSVTLSITPIIDLGVAIDTATVNLNFTMDMAATDFTVKPATLTVLGTYGPQEIDVAAANNSAVPVWTLDTDETPTQDELQLYMLFSVNRDSAPLNAEFTGTKNLVTGATKRIGTFSGTGADGNFENNVMLGGADMDNLSPTQERQMWLRIDTPPTTSTTQAQDIQLTFTATKDNL